MIEMKKSLISLQDAMEEFIIDCKVRNLSPDTIKYYNQSFNYFNNYINQLFKDKEVNIISTIKKKTIDQYVLYMKDKKLKDSTINNKLRGIRSILYFFMQNDYIDTFEIKLIKEDETIQNLYTTEEIRKLIQKPNIKTCSFAEYRTWVVVCFLVSTGVRSRTLRFIQIKDLDFENQLISLTTTKGRKQVYIPMSTTLKKILLEYLKIRGNNESDFLFCNLEGKQLTRNALIHIIKNYNTKRGVKKTGIHLFRHYFAKNYIQNGGNALKLQKLLAHRTLSQTQRYVDLYGQDLQQGFDEYNPLDQLSPNKERIKIQVA